MNEKRENSEQANAGEELEPGKKTNSPDSELPVAPGHKASLREQEESSQSSQNSQGKIPRRRSNAPGKHTVTWKLFETLFLQAKIECYPLYVRGLTKGQAINLAIGLNRCNLAFAREQGMPDDAMLYSAKAKEETGRNIEGTDQPGWLVEISTNWKRQGKASPSRASETSGAARLENLLSSLTIPPGSSMGVSALEPTKPIPGSGSNLGSKLSPAPDAGEIPSQEDLINRFISGE